MADIDIVNERSTRIYTATVTDENDVAVPLANISTLTLTLYNQATQTIINSRDAQDVLNTNNVTVHATSGLVTWTLQPLDTSIEGPTPLGDFERRVALFEWVLIGGSEGNHEYVFDVRNLHSVP